MQSDAQSAFCKKSHPNDRPGLHFGGLWGHFGALWPPNGTPDAFLERLKFRCKNGSSTELQERAGAGRSGGGPYKP